MFSPIACPKRNETLDVALSQLECKRQPNYTLTHVSGVGLSIRPAPRECSRTRASIRKAPPSPAGPSLMNLKFHLFTRIPSGSTVDHGNNGANAASSIRSMFGIRSKRYVRYAVGFSPFSFAVSTML